MKICPKCSIEKPISEFYSVKGLFRYQCTPCRKIMNKEYYHGGKGEKIKNHRKENPEEYETFKIELVEHYVRLAVKEMKKS